jgi:hypothetical protein
MSTTAQSTTAIHLIDAVGPSFGAALCVLLMSLLREPNRKTFNAIFVGGASGVYLSGGFGVWELLYPVVATPIAFMGLRSYRFIGIAWLMHSCWDIAHHIWGNPIWPFMPTSSFGCMIFDAVLAVWFMAGAPAISRSFRMTSKAS